MSDTFGYQVGMAMAALQVQLSQLAQAHRDLAQQVQEKSDLFEALARQMGWEYSQDQRRWIARAHAE